MEISGAPEIDGTYTFNLLGRDGDPVEVRFNISATRGRWRAGHMRGRMRFRGWAKIGGGDTFPNEPVRGTVWRALGLRLDGIGGYWLVEDPESAAMGGREGRPLCVFSREPDPTWSNFVAFVQSHFRPANEVVIEAIPALKVEADNETGTGSGDTGVIGITSTELGQVAPGAGRGVYYGQPNGIWYDLSLGNADDSYTLRRFENNAYGIVPKEDGLYEVLFYTTLHAVEPGKVRFRFVRQSDWSAVAEATFSLIDGETRSVHISRVLHVAANDALLVIATLASHSGEIMVWPAGASTTTRDTGFYFSRKWSKD